MGSGAEKKPMREIDETRGSLRDDAFDAIVERIREAGTITSDETVPLYQDIGMDQFEVGTQRELQFTVRDLEFKLKRKVETQQLQGEGRMKHVEDMDTPKIIIVLQQKQPYSEDWKTLDLDVEDMFG